MGNYQRQNYFLGFIIGGIVIVSSIIFFIEYFGASTKTEIVFHLNGSETIELL